MSATTPGGLYTVGTEVLFRGESTHIPFIGRIEYVADYSEADSHMGDVRYLVKPLVLIVEDGWVDVRHGARWHQWCYPDELLVDQPRSKP